LDESSGNVDESGNFSIQVLRTAVERSHDLKLLESRREEAKAADIDPTLEQAFVCNLAEHWFSIRKLRGKWWNLNSINKKPEIISDFYLDSFLAQLRAQR
jgi:ataxin-3